MSGYCPVLAKNPISNGPPSGTYLNHGGAVHLLIAFAKIGLGTLHGFPQIRLVNDVVPIEDGSRFVAADGHRYPLRNLGPDHVSDSGPAKIMENTAHVSGSNVAFFAPVVPNGSIATVAHQLPQTSRNAGRCPCFPKVSHPLAVPMKYIGGEEDACLPLDLHLNLPA